MADKEVTPSAGERNEKEEELVFRGYALYTYNANR
jgi:hypothetical protein